MGGSETFVTVMFWGIVGLAWVGSGVGASRGDGLQAVVMLVVALLLGGLALWLRYTQPMRYRVEQDGLVIERRVGTTRIAGRIERHAGQATLGLRLGSGGLYGYRGRFRIAAGGWANAFVTDVKRSSLITVGGRSVVLSPVDPAALVQEVVTNA
ncbi:MAG: PH domain-containing protein [Actinobacteria bacterium]|nr:PH domain-containing protein [Actinomycetota bacterium]